MEGNDDQLDEGECKRAKKLSPSHLKEGASGSECRMVDFQHRDESVRKALHPEVLIKGRKEHF